MSKKEDKGIMIMKVIYLMRALFISFDFANWAPVTAAASSSNVVLPASLSPADLSAEEISFLARRAGAGLGSSLLFLSLVSFLAGPPNLLLIFYLFGPFQSFP